MPNNTDTPRRRTNTSARKAGQQFERTIANHLRDALDDRIDIRPKNGKNDRGDIGGVRTVQGARVVLELKNHATMSLGAWLNEAETERGNDDAALGIVIHKRRGIATAGDQFVTMTVDDLVKLLAGA